MNKNIKSTISKITEDIFTAKDFITAKNIFVSHISETNIKDKDKMLYDVEQINNLYKLQYYCANSLLKFEGLSLTKPENK